MTTYLIAALVTLAFTIVLTVAGLGAAFIVASVLSPLGAYTSSFMPVTALKWVFVGFLVFAAVMMRFYKPKPRPAMAPAQVAGVGMGVGGAAGFLGGMLGLSLIH